MELYIAKDPGKRTGPPTQRARKRLTDLLEALDDTLPNVDARKGC